MSLSKFQFLGYKVLKSSIDMSEGMIAEPFGLSLKFKTSGIVNKTENTFTLNLGVNIENPDSSIKIEINAVGDFKFEPTGDEKIISQFFYTNASAILFPYLRAYISTLTNLSGLKAVNLPTMNLSNLAEELKNNTVFLE